MRTVIHISDIHFGRAEMTTINSMVEAFLIIKPDLIIISGDLTQRATIQQFKHAEALLHDFKCRLELFRHTGQS